MKKIFAVGLLLIALSFNCFAAEITFTISPDKVARIKAMLQNDMTSSWYAIAEDHPQWTDLQIAKEVIRIWIRGRVYIYERRIARESAVNAVEVDDDIMR